MRPVSVPTAVSERLGGSASAALIEWLDEHTRVSTEYVMGQCAERFERRLVEETSKLRVDIAQLRADLREEMTSNRFELLKWAFIFWVGQFVSVAGIVGLMLRTLPVR